MTRLAALLVVVLFGLIVIYLFRSETAVDSGWREPYDPDEMFV